MFENHVSPILPSMFPSDVFNRLVVVILVSGIMGIGVVDVVMIVSILGTGLEAAVMSVKEESTYYEYTQTRKSSYHHVKLHSVMLITT